MRWLSHGARTSRQRGQSIIEFGIIALTFVLLLFAIVDVGMLVNTWLRLSSATRDVARMASVGTPGTELQNFLRAQALPGVSANLGSFSGYCCVTNNKVVLTVAYYDHCIPGPGCTQITSPSQIFTGYWPGNGTCATGTAGCHPRPGDTLLVTVAAPGMEVITPLVRPFFESGTCRGTDAHCYVRLGSTTMVYFEGPLTGIV